MVVGERTLWVAFCAHRPDRLDNRFAPRLVVPYTFIQLDKIIADGFSSQPTYVAYFGIFSIRHLWWLWYLVCIYQYICFSIH